MGDPTMSVKELCVLQEVLIREKDRTLLEEVGKRENVPVMVMDKITVTGHMVKESKTGETVELVLGELPKKTFLDHYGPTVLKPLDLPKELTLMQVLDRVLRLLSMGSKRFLWFLWILTSKMGRSVTGFVAQAVLRPAAPVAERRGGACAESLLHDGLCDGPQRITHE